MTGVRLVAVATFMAVLAAHVGAQTEGVGAPEPVSSRSGVERYTAGVQGVVTAADSGAPVQGAEVRLMGSGRQRLTTSDASGRFAFTDLPPEPVTLHVSKAGFVEARYGQRHPLQEATPIVLGEGQQVTADVALSRGGVIYGHVLDEYGEPAAGALVQALLSRTLRGRPGLQAAALGGDQADDTGAFRIYGLAPGTYYVSAQPGPAGTVRRGAATYYPGTPSVAAAQPVTIDTDAQVPVSITLSTGSLVSVSGGVTNSAGVPRSGSVVLASQDLMTARALGLDGPANLSLGAFQLNGPVGPDGRFTIADVPPGSYVLTATLTTPPLDGFRAFVDMTEEQRRAAEGPLRAEALRRSLEREAASLPVFVSGEDVSGLTIVTRRLPRLSGRFVSAPGVRQPLPSSLMVTTQSQQTPMQMLIGGPTSEVFEIAAPPGPFTLAVMYRMGADLPAGWAVGAIRLNGRDVTDEEIEVFSDATVEIVLTDRVTTVSGRVRAGRDGDAGNTSVVVFPQDERRWTYPSRAIRSARTDATGRFEITGLPPGRRYLAVAVDYLVVEEEYDPAFLGGVRGRATEFALDGEDDRRTLQLDLVER